MFPHARAAGAPRTAGARRLRPPGNVRRKRAPGRPSDPGPRPRAPAITGAGLRIDAVHHLATEWGEYAEEHSATPGHHLLRAARLSRDPDRYIARFGRAAYEVMLGDSLWHIYRMIGKLSSRIYLLSRADSHR